MVYNEEVVEGGEYLWYVFVNQDYFRKTLSQTKEPDERILDYDLAAAVQESEEVLEPVDEKVGD